MGITQTLKFVNTEAENRIQPNQGDEMVEQPSLLRTKLYAPARRPALVERKRLLDELNANLTGKAGFSRTLTLIAAPAGYGKTTLAYQWLETVKAPVAWLSLDADDNDPTRFLHYLIAALQTVLPEVGADVQLMLDAPQRPPDEVVMTALINDLSTTPESLILVLDDYHVVHTPIIHKQLTAILDHQPANLHLVITTREDPLLPIPLLRARGHVLEIRQEDLRFTTTESAEFLKDVMGLSISSDEIAALESRTEGWIAGLQLAALSMRGRDDCSSFIQALTGSSRFILDFLIEEVFDRQPADVKDFLLKTSILERLSGPLCDAVAEESDSQNLLEALEQANLFIVPLDQSRTWYRYHRLFGELLRNRLRVAGHPSEVSLHQRASEWFENEALVSEAIQHALMAQDWGRAATLISQASDGLLKRGELVTLIGWYQKIPEYIIRENPDFGMSYAWGLLLIGRFEEAEELLNHFEEAVRPIPEALGQVATAQAYAARARGDNKQVIERSEQALALLPEREFTARSTLALNLGLVYWHEGKLREAVPVLNEAQELSERVGNYYAGLTAQIFLARTRASQGALRQAEEMLQTTLRIGGQIPILVLSHYDLSCIYYEWNELGKAWSHLDQGMEMCMQSGNLEFQNGGHMIKAFLLMVQGNVLEALAEIETSHALSRDFGPATQARSMACHAQVALAMGDIATARHWAEQMSEDVDPHSLYRFIGLTRARLLLAQGEREAARQLLAERLAKATKEGWGFATIAIRALQAQAAEKEETALEILAEGLKLSQPEGFIRSYVDSGAGLVPLLRESARRGVLPSYVGRILSAYDDGKKASLSLVEPLSERELEVLRLVTAGMSNREIAEKLVISIGTAKTHVHNICGKLGVRNRTEAAMRAKELGLV